MKGKLVSISMIVFIILPAFGLSIASFIIASQNHDITCDFRDDVGNTIMTLPTWLYVHGGFSLVMSIIFAVVIYFLINKPYPENTIVFYMVLLILYQMFTVIWSILGAIILFGNSMDCLYEAKSIWIMVLIDLICQWYGFFQTPFNCGLRDKYIVA